MNADTIKKGTPPKGARKYNKQNFNLSGDNSIVKAIKAKLGTVQDVWRWLGLPDVPPQGDNAYPSPFREDRKPSLSIYDGGRQWMDKAEGNGGDVIDFYAKYHALSNEEAIKQLKSQQPTSWRPVKASTPKAREKPKKQREPLKVPQLDRGSIAELNALRQLRALDCWAGLQILFDCGMFGFSCKRANCQRIN